MTETSEQATAPRMDDAELLRRYAEQRSEEAFAELVRRHVDLVYSVALRQAGGDAHLAQDVAQVVFASLARKAAALAERPVLGGWLYRTTQFAAIDAVRAASRRRARETEAHTMQSLAPPAGADVDWEKLRPTLDQAIGELADDDRDAVVLRFFEGKSFADVGARLRLSENTARMRVERALDKLHASLSRRGVTSTTAALVLVLANHVAAAPAGLATSVTGVALAGAAAGGAKTGAAVVAGSLFKFGSTKIIAAAAAVAVAAGSVAIQQVGEVRAIRAELAAVTRNLVALRVMLTEPEERLSAVEQRAQAAEADAGQLLKAIQDAAPLVALPPGNEECVAFVIDTSGSMRNPNGAKLWSGVFQAINATLAAHGKARFLVGFDADGRIIFSAGREWLPRTPVALAAIERALDDYQLDTISNPVPGIYRAMRMLPPAGTMGARLHVCVIGDEFTDQAEPVLRRLADLNPPDASGHRRATISAIQLPTTIRSTGPTAGQMGNTGVKFQNLMQEVAKQHGGAYQLLSDEALH